MQAQNRVVMKKLKEYDIPFVGLKLGKHYFEYEIKKEFFEKKENEPAKIDQTYTVTKPSEAKPAAPSATGGFANLGGTSMISGGGSAFGGFGIKTAATAAPALVALAAN